MQEMSPGWFSFYNLSVMCFLKIPSFQKEARSWWNADWAAFNLHPNENRSMSCLSEPRQPLFLKIIPRFGPNTGQM